MLFPETSRHHLRAFWRTHIRTYDVSPRREDRALDPGTGGGHLEGPQLLIVGDNLAEDLPPVFGGNTSRGLIPEGECLGRHWQSPKAQSPKAQSPRTPRETPPYGSRTTLRPHEPLARGSVLQEAPQGTRAQRDKVQGTTVQGRLGGCAVVLWWA